MPGMLLTESVKQMDYEAQLNIENQKRKIDMDEG